MKNLVFALMAAACSAYAGLVDIDGDPVTTNTMLGSVDQESGTVGDLLELKAVPDGEIRRIAREEAEQVTVGATNALTVAMTNRYTKAETDGLLDGKTDKTNTYTKAEVNGLVDAAGKVKSVNGKDGEVVLTASDVHALPDTYTPPVQPTDTNAVRDIIRDEITPATNRLNQTLSDALDAHVTNANNPHSVTAAQVGAVPLVKDQHGEKTAVTIGNRRGIAGMFSLAHGSDVSATEYYSHAEGENTSAYGYCSHSEGKSTTASGDFSHAEGIDSKTEKDHAYAFVWNGDSSRSSPYYSHGPGTFNINPVGNLNGFFIGEQTLAATLTNKADASELNAHVENTNNPHAVTAAQVEAVPLVKDQHGEKTAVTIGNRIGTVGPFSIANGNDVTASDYYSHAEGSETVAAGATSHAEGLLTIANGQSSHAEGRNTAAYGSYSHTEGCYSKTRTDDDYAFTWNGDDTKTVESPYTSHGPGTFNINPVGGPEGFYIGEQKISQVINAVNAERLSAIESTLGNKRDKTDNICHKTEFTEWTFYPSIPTGYSLRYEQNVQGFWGWFLYDANGKKDGGANHGGADPDATNIIVPGYEWSGGYSFTATRSAAACRSNDTFVTWAPMTNAIASLAPAPVDYASVSNAAIYASNTVARIHINATDPVFSNAVLAVQISTNEFAALYELKDAFAELPIDPVTGGISIGSLLAALASAVVWLKKNKVQTLKLNDNSVETSAENGVAKLDNFFTESNSLLNGRLAYSRNATGLKDRAFNTLSFDGTEYNLSNALVAVTPTANGQPRDLLIVATATAATTISFTADTIKGDKPTIDGSGTWLITLTEYASGVWYCRQIKMEDAA